MSFKKKLINLTLVIFSILLVIYGLELIIHLTIPDFLGTRYSITGDFSDFVNRRFFDASIFNKDPKVFRILGIGDSFSVSFKGEKLNYHDILEKQLNKINHNKKYEVVNAGISNTGPGYYWNTLEKYGDSFKPDLVLIEFFIGNDFLEMNFDTKRIGLFINEPVHNKWGLLTYLRFKNLWLYQYGRGRWVVWLDSLRKGEGTFSEEAFMRIEKARLYFFEKRQMDEFNKSWNRNSGVLSKIIDWCNQRKTPLVIIIIPDQLQIDQKLFRTLIKKFNIPEKSIDLYYPNRQLVNFLVKKNVHYLDLTKPMQEAAKSKTLYLLRDTHWNHAGHELAGSMISEYLQKNHLLQ
jgi:hypothetical protein